MIELVPFIVLAFAAYRVTRFLIFDTLIAHSREKFYVRLANGANSPKRFWAFINHKLLEGLSCSWCLGVWVTGALFWIYQNESPSHWGRLGWLSYAGLAGAQGLLHAYEPGDE